MREKGVGYMYVYLGVHFNDPCIHMSKSHNNKQPQVRHYVWVSQDVTQILTRLSSMACIIDILHDTISNDQDRAHDRLELDNDLE